MIRRLVRNLKVGDIIYTEVPDRIGDGIACGEVTEVNLNCVEHKPAKSGFRSLVRYEVYKELDTISLSLSESWYFDTKITVLEPGEKDLLLLGK